jgi:hypothetical protein
VNFVVLGRWYVYGGVRALPAASCLIFLQLHGQYGVSLMVRSST